MKRDIARLRIEANGGMELRFVDYLDDDGQVYYSQAMPSHIPPESAHRIVDAMNHPEAVIVVDDWPPQEGKRIYPQIRLQ